MAARLTTKSLARAVRSLERKDPDLARIARTDGPPPLWSRRPGLATLAKIVMEQQVSQVSGAAVYRRLAAGVVPLTAQELLRTGDRGIRALGITRQKSACLLAIARAVAEGALDFQALGRMDDERAHRTLVAIRGIGPWTAGIYLLMAMGRADIWPTGDVALRTAIRVVKGLGPSVAWEEMEKVAERWRPYRAVAARLLWNHYLRHGRTRLGRAPA